jgi:hypothetical protein
LEESVPENEIPLFAEQHGEFPGLREAPREPVQQRPHIHGDERFVGPGFADAEPLASVLTPR